MKSNKQSINIFTAMKGGKNSQQKHVKTTKWKNNTKHNNKLRYRSESYGLNDDKTEMFFEKMSILKFNYEINDFTFDLGGLSFQESWQSYFRNFPF